MNEPVKLRRYQGAVWDEPVVMTLSHPGRRGVVFPRADVPGDLSAIPAAMRRKVAPQLPEMSEPDVLRHYLHLSQQTLGMMGISLFGTCTMKYNARVNEAITARDDVAHVHPRQPDSTLQGSLQIMHNLDLNLRALSGMDRFVFQAAGGADAAFLHVCVTRAYHAARGELQTRDEIITSIQSHPCNPATAATAGFKVITLPLEANGYPSLDALKAAVSSRTAALLINNPDDMGIYNPDIAEWVRVVKAAGGLCFYDHANFNGVMSKVRARDLGFDACMFMLHKTFGAPKGGGGPAVGAYGCSAELIPYLPGPLLVQEHGEFRLEAGSQAGIGRVREFLGNLPPIIKAYAWVRAMGIEGIAEASDLSVLANNYMGKRLSEIRGVTCSHPGVKAWRLEMTRYSLEVLEQETGVSAYDVQNRMVDYGVDAFWLAHEPWVIAQPFTPEAGEMWSKQDIDYWIAVLAQVCQEAYDHPERVRTAPHNHVIGRLDSGPLEDPARWATTWRAYQRKHPGTETPR